MSGVERYLRPQTVAEALALFDEAARSPLTRLRVHLASAILGRRLFRLQRDVWAAEGERDAWLHTVELRSKADARTAPPGIEFEPLSQPGVCEVDLLEHDPTVTP